LTGVVLVATVPAAHTGVLHAVPALYKVQLLSDVHSAIGAGLVSPAFCGLTMISLFVPENEHSVTFTHLPAGIALVTMHSVGDGDPVGLPAGM
jgi:hypothetical protein